MMFPVKYNIPHRFGKVMTFFGEGIVHLLETAVILEGQLPRVQVPFVLTAYHQLFCGHTARTVPYAAITRYGRPSLLSGWHVLVFGMPDGSKIVQYTVEFGLKERAMKDDFINRMQTAMAAATKLQGRLLQ